MDEVKELNDIVEKIFSNYSSAYEIEVKAFQLKALINIIRDDAIFKLGRDEDGE